MRSLCLLIWQKVHILLTMKEQWEEHNHHKIRFQLDDSISKKKWAHTTEMQQLIMLLKGDMYLYWCRFNEDMNVVQDIFWTLNSVKLLNPSNIMLMIDNT